jgi:hypothetical protein
LTWDLVKQNLDYFDYPKINVLKLFPQDPMSKPILVTGSHRSGSTWVGKMIAESPQIHYIHEPFNVTHPPGGGICRAQFNYWYTYISSENEEMYYKALKDTVEFSYSTLSAFRRIKSHRHIKKVIRDYYQFKQSRAQNLRPLLKDPIALFSAEWLEAKFNVDVIVIMRHPAAFVSSLKRKDWQYPFSHFLQQAHLMQELPNTLQEEIETYANTTQEIINQASLVWKICHSRILQYQKGHPEWIFVRHEDLSLDPLGEFSKIYNYLGLEFSPKIEAAIQDHSNSDNPSEAPNNATHVLKRNSQENIKNWKYRLSNPEINIIREQVEEISQNFYGDSDW